MNKLKQIKKEIEEILELPDLALDSNKRSLVRGRVIFGRVGRALDFSLEEIGAVINKAHSTILYYTDRYSDFTAHKKENQQISDFLIEKYKNYFEL